MAVIVVLEIAIETGFAVAGRRKGGAGETRTERVRLASAQHAAAALRAVARRARATLDLGRFSGSKSDAFGLAEIATGTGGVVADAHRTHAAGIGSAARSPTRRVEQAREDVVATFEAVAVVVER